MPTFREDLKLGTKVPLVKTDDINDRAVTTRKLADGCVTGEKIADGSVGYGKLDDELRRKLEVAEQLPTDLPEQLEEAGRRMDELEDAVFPIEVELHAVQDLDRMLTTVSYTVKSKGEPLVPDTLCLTKSKTLGYDVLTEEAKAEGEMESPIEAGTERFVLTVMKGGRTGQTAAVTRMLCYYGAGAESAALDTLKKTGATDDRLRLTVETQDGEYIWIAVPQNMAVERVTSSGIEVTMEAAQMTVTPLGIFKAYRTANALAAATWELTIE